MPSNLRTTNQLLRYKLIKTLFTFCLLLGSTASVLAQTDQPSIIPVTSAESAMADDTDQTSDEDDVESDPIEWFKAIISLIQYLAWPATFVLLLLIFRTQIIQLVEILSSRMQSGKLKLLGAEFEITNAVTNTKEFEKLVEQKVGEKPDIIGNPDMFQLLFKATSPSLSKSTKVMNTPNGCIVQVTTKEISKNGSISVAEAVTFIPDININIEKTENNEVRKTEFLSLSQQK